MNQYLKWMSKTKAKLVLYNRNLRLKVSLKIPRLVIKVTHRMKSYKLKALELTNRVMILMEN